MDPRLYMLAGTFALLVIALIATIVSAVRDSRRRHYDPNEAPSTPFEWPALPPAPDQPVDTSLDGLELDVPTDSPSAALLTPLRTGEWHPPEEAPAPAASLSQASLYARVASFEAVAEIAALATETPRPEPASAPLPEPALAQLAEPEPKPALAPLTEPEPKPAPAPLAEQPLESGVELPVPDSIFPAEVQTAAPQPATAPATAAAPAVARPSAPRKFIIPEVRSEPVPATPAAITSPVPTLAPVTPDETGEFTPDWAALLERLESSAFSSASPAPVASQSVAEDVVGSTPPSATESQYEIPAETAAAVEPIVVVPEPPPAPAIEPRPTPAPEPEPHPTPAPAQTPGPAHVPEPMATALVSEPILPSLPSPPRTQRPRMVVRSIDAVRPAPGPSPVLEPLVATAPTAAGATDRSDIEDIVMAAPVEMWFGDSRIGVKAGTKTYAQFRKYADVLFGDLKTAKTRNR